MPFSTEERFIRDAEISLGVTFPSEFRSRLLNVNGGEVEVTEDTWQLFPVFDTTDRRRTTRTASHIVRETATAREWVRFPETAVAIGENGTGDLLVLRVSSTDPSTLAETIFLWQHETGELTEVAASIGELHAEG